MRVETYRTWSGAGFLRNREAREEQSSVAVLAERLWGQEVRNPQWTSPTHQVITASKKKDAPLW
jgi:hypothetical protein